MTMMVCVWALMMSAQTLVMSDSVKVAEDFSVVTVGGQEMKLSDLPKGRLTILVFFDPDCKVCRQTLF